MPTNIHTVTAKELHAEISGSVLMTEDRKTKLTELLSRLDETEMRALHALLLSEDDIIRDIAKRAIARAITEGDTKFLEGLDLLIHSSMKLLRESGEKEATKGEATAAEHFFDAA